VTVFQLPSTYIRTFPLYGYAGTVAGFTSAILLLCKRPVVSVAIQRIIDTYIGVVIYTSIEFAVCAISTEEEILNSIQR
jgi:hypothetical protein